MKNYKVGVVALAALMFYTFGLLGLSNHYRAHHQVQAFVPTVVAPSPAPETTKQYAAALDVARVFGRSPGCAEADPKLITDVAAESLASSMDPRLLAATVAVESGCDAMAVSRRGAIGLTQIMPKVWASKFDFTGKVNLFNPNENLHAGATILGGLVKQYGTSEGVRRYQGTGTECPSCDDNYVPKILSLAGRK